MGFAVGFNDGRVGRESGALGAGISLTGRFTLGAGGSEEGGTYTVVGVGAAGREAAWAGVGDRNRCGRNSRGGGWRSRWGRGGQARGTDRRACK